MLNSNAISLAKFFTQNGVDSMKSKNHVLNSLYELVIKHDIHCLDTNNGYYLYLTKYNNFYSVSDSIVIEYFSLYLVTECKTLDATPKVIKDFVKTLTHICKGCTLEENLDIKTQIFIRFGGIDNKIYLKLDSKDNFIEIDSSGWRPVNTTPVLFIHGQHNKSLPTPKNVDKYQILQLKQFLNCSEDQFKMIICFLVHAMFPENLKDDKVILNLEGKAGSAKSTICKIIRSLLDPNIAETVGLDNSTKDIDTLTKDQWLVIFDNVSEITTNLSNALCRISTNAGYAKRKLYTDSTKISGSIKRPMILNGIGNYMEREDLLDRCLHLSLPALDRKEAPTIFWERFEQSQPEILGALLSLLSEVLRIMPEIKAPENFRMVDFARLGCAIEKCLNWEEGFFVKTYQSMLFGMAEENLEHDPVGGLLIKYLESMYGKSDVFEARFTPNLLFMNLRHYDKTIGNMYNNFPKDVNVFAKKLYRLETTLTKKNIYMNKGKSCDRVIILGRK